MALPGNLGKSVVWIVLVSYRFLELFLTSFSLFEKEILKLDHFCHDGGLLSLSILIFNDFWTENWTYQPLSQKLL